MNRWCLDARHNFLVRMFLLVILSVFDDFLTRNLMLVMFMFVVDWFMDVLFFLCDFMNMVDLVVEVMRMDVVLSMFVEDMLVVMILVNDFLEGNMIMKDLLLLLFKAFRFLDIQVWFLDPDVLMMLPNHWWQNRFYLLTLTFWNVEYWLK